MRVRSRCARAALPVRLVGGRVALDETKVAWSLTANRKWAGEDGRWYNAWEFIQMFIVVRLIGVVDVDQWMGKEVCLLDAGGIACRCVGVGSIRCYFHGESEGLLIVLIWVMVKR